jgi:hypothetical protein
MSQPKYRRVQTYKARHGNEIHLFGVQRSDGSFVAEFMGYQAARTMCARLNHGSLTEEMAIAMTFDTNPDN